MNRSDLVYSVAVRAGLTKKQAELAVVSMVGEISDALRRGDRVSIKGFGVFTRRERAARPGTNPRNGTKIVIPARNVVHFQPTLDLDGE